MSLTAAQIETPVGPLALVIRGNTLAALTFDRHDDALRRALGDVDGLPAASARSAVLSRLRAYFDGDLGALETIDVELHGTPFQVRVWEELRKIPVGKTIAYLDLAERIGQPSAVRAVAGANGRNPVAIVVPCHRVIAKDGSLHGYGGGLPKKQWLLEHEGAIARSLVAV